MTKIEVDKQGLKLNKLTDQTKEVETFRKRLEFLESRFDIYKENTLQNVDQLHETFRRVKEQLEHKVSQVTMFHEQIQTLQDKATQMQVNLEDHRGRVTEELVQQSQRLGGVEAEMQELRLITSADLTEMMKRLDDMKIQVLEFQEDNDVHFQNIDIKFEHAAVEDTLRVTHDQLRQNFQGLNEVL